MLDATYSTCNPINHKFSDSASSFLTLRRCPQSFPVILRGCAILKTLSFEVILIQVMERTNLA